MYASGPAAVHIALQVNLHAVGHAWLIARRVGKQLLFINAKEAVCVLRIAQLVSRVSFNGKTGFQISILCQMPQWQRAAGFDFAQ